MIEQGTDDWRNQRAGKITASRFGDALAVLKTGKPAEARLKYSRQLAFEIVSGQPIHGISSLSMIWGTGSEPLARGAYELATGNVVMQAEFAVHPDFPYIGASADGLVGTDGGIEIKCPHDESVHIKTWLEGMPADHMPQVQGNMWVHGRAWWDFISYDPRADETYRLYVQRIPFDAAYVQELKKALIMFWQDVQDILKRLEERAA